MNYIIKPAENQHVDVLPSIERAAAEMFSLKDLPLKHRSEVMPRDDFQNAKERDFLEAHLPGRFGRIIHSVRRGVNEQVVVAQAVHLREGDVHVKFPFFER